MRILKQSKALVFLALVVSLAVTSCGSLNPKNHAKALKQYTYEVESVENFRAAGVSINSNLENTPVSSLAGVALGLLTKDLPLEARVNMKVSNPAGESVPMGPFKYIIEIQGKPLFEGSVSESLRISNGESKVIPLSFRANLFGVSDQNKGPEKILSDILTRKSTGLLALKIKPSVRIAGKDIYYPGYITVDSDLLKGISSVIKK